MYSIVIPCYKSSHTLKKLVTLTTEEMQKMNREDLEFVLVNDCSPDGGKTLEVLRQLAEENENVRVINLAKNVGQHNAMMAGLRYAKGDTIISMDDDMQTHPSQIFKLVEKIQEGYDLVYGHYGKRKNSSLKNLSSKLNEVSSRILLGRPKEITSSNFWIITKKVAEETRKYDSYNPYIDGIFYRITHNIGNVEVEHHKREVGTSNYTLHKLIRLWLAYWNYSVIPLRI